MNIVSLFFSILPITPVNETINYYDYNSPEKEYYAEVSNNMDISFIHQKGTNLIDWEFNYEVLTPNNVHNNLCLISISQLWDIGTYYNGEGTVFHQKTITFTNKDYNSVIGQHWIISTKMKASFNGYLVNNSENSFYSDSNCFVFGSGILPNQNISYNIIDFQNSVFQTSLSWYLEPLLKFDSIPLNDSIGLSVYTFDKVLSFWRLQNLDSLFLAHPNYKIRIYNSTNDLIFQDQNFQIFKYVRTLFI